MFVTRLGGRKIVGRLGLILFVGLLAVGQAVAQDAAAEANRRLGRGLNLGNFLEAPRGANWGVQVEDRHLAMIRDVGFQSIRLPVRWSDYAGEEPPYRLEREMLERVDHLLQVAHAAGLNVVLNNHHYQGLDADPDAHRQRFKAIWQQLAQRYRDHGEWLLFELHNEPHDQLTAEKWNAILRDGIAVVRQSNPTRIIVVGPDRWNNIRALPDLRLPDDPRLIVTVHMYEPFEFTHQGASWVGDRVRSIRDRTWGSPSEVEQVRQLLGQAAEWGRQHQRPIYVGEFGAYSAAPLESRIKWTRTVARTAESLGMSWAYWEFAAGFGVYDPQAERWRRPLLDALLPDNPLRAAE
ncbi:MAG: glycoside hydrolase family 5 protein [Planctomycetota bacterium]|nr:MAG: glycoside hydrolase family 5 protein [Planctomycetota bacterium]